MPLLQADRAPGWIAGWAVNTFALRVLIVWISNNAGRSVLTAILFHATGNLGWALFPNNGSHFDPVVVGAITALTAAVVTAVWGPRTLTRDQTPARAGRSTIPAGDG